MSRPDRWRTTNPWGHVSKAQRLYRLKVEQATVAYIKVTKIEGGKERLEEMRTLLKKQAAMTDDEKRRVNELANWFNSNGIDDRILEMALD